jgi:hypothetical protein
MHMEAKEQLQELQQQVRQLRQERNTMQQQQPYLARSPDKLDRHSWHLQHGQMTASEARQSAGVLAGTSTQPAAFALQFSRALQTADADRSAAVRRAVTAEQTSAELRQHLNQQEQELEHLRR